MLCTGRLPKDELYCSSLPQASDYPLPDPLSNWSCTDLVSQALPGSTIQGLYPIDGNDTIGDCTCAGAAHAITVQNGLIGQKVIPLASDVVSLYRQLGNGADNGLPLTTVLQAWRSGILGGQKIIADVNVDPSNSKAVRQIIQYLGGAFIGFNITSNTVSQFQAGQPWDVSGRERGGHCVYVTGFDDDKKLFRCLTWGNVQYGTYAWWDQYVDEVHGILTSTAAVYDSDTIAAIQQAMPALSL